jgi:methyl-accepting chemotaxis protein
MLTQIRRFLAAPVFEDEEKTRVAGLLNTILLTLFLGTLGYSAYYILALQDDGLVSTYYILAETAVGILSLVIPWVLMRRGYVRRASLLFTVLMGVLLFFFAYESGGVRGYEYASLVLIPVTAGLLLGTRAAVVAGGLIVLSGLVLMAAEAAGLLLSTFDPASLSLMDVWVTRSFDLAAVTGLLYLSSRSLTSALKDARRNNRELRSARISLEERVSIEQERREQLAVLFGVGTTLISTLDPQEVLDAVCREVAKILRVTSAYICDWDEDARTSTVVAEHKNPEASTQERVSRLGVTCLEDEYIAEWLDPEHPRAMCLSDPDLSPRERRQLEEHGVMSMLCLRLVARGRILGYIEIWESRSERIFGEDEVLLTQNLASQAGVAIENARLLEAIQETVGELSSAISAILSTTTQQVTGASQQSAAIAETSTTIDEVRAIAEQTAQRAQSVADIAQQTADVSQTGQQAVSNTIAGVEQIRRRVEAIASDISTLSDQTQAIGNIIATVNEIASQSNMLALNAAVEAARAGEAGKGFAVVAGEVRHLAEQSQAATEQVREILAEILSGVEAAVMATEIGVRQADEGMKLAGEAGLAIQSLADSVTDSTQAAAQIAAASGQQLGGMEQIAQAMENINQATAQNVTGVQQVERTAGELSNLARQLRELLVTVDGS